MRAFAAALVAALGLAAVACSRADRAPSAPAPLGLSAPQLRPMLATFTELARAVPAPPPAAALAEAEQLLEAAFASDIDDRRLVARSRNALLAGEHAGAVLERALAHARADVRAGAVFELGRREQPDALLPLVLRLKYETDPGVRVWVADALIHRGCGAGVAVLLAALRVPATQELAGQRAIEVLRALGDELDEAPTWDALEAALRIHGAHWRDTGTLRGRALADDATTRARLAALLAALQGFQLRPVDDARFVLSRTGTLALPLLRQAVAASEPFLRTHALEVLRDLGPAASSLAPDVLPLLADALTRTDAARALGAMRATQAVPHLLAWLSSSDLELRTAAAWALGPIGDPRALAPLHARMDDANEALDLRVMAAASVALFELDRPAYRFLHELRAKKGYHEPTLDELIDRVDRWGAPARQ